MSRHLLAGALALAVLVHPLPTRAEADPLEAAAQRALAASPALTAIARALDAAEARARSAGAWPNPSLVTQLQLSSNYTSNMVTVGFRQPLDLRGLAVQRRAYAEEEVAALEAERRRLASALGLEARLAVLERWRAEAAVEAQSRQVAFLEGEAARDRRRVAEGALAPHELTHVEFELAGAKLARQGARHEAERARARLNGLWGLDAEAPTPAPARRVEAPQPIAPLAEWLASARERRPEIAAAEVAYRRETRAVRLAESLRFGEGELDLEAGTTGNTDPTFYGAFGLPVPVWNAREGEVSAARADAARQEANREAAGRGVAQEVVDAYLEARQAAERHAEAATVLVPLAAHAVEKAESRVKAGLGVPTELLEARQEALRAEEARTRALIDYHMAMARLRHAAGR